MVSLLVIAGAVREATAWQRLIRTSDLRRQHGQGASDVATPDDAFVVSFVAYIVDTMRTPIRWSYLISDRRNNREQLIQKDLLFCQRPYTW